MNSPQIIMIAVSIFAILFLVVSVARNIFIDTSRAKKTMEEFEKFASRVNSAKSRQEVIALGDEIFTFAQSPEHKRYINYKRLDEYVFFMVGKNNAFKLMEHHEN